jgi:hypothetical protein
MVLRIRHLVLLVAVAQTVCGSEPERKPVELTISPVRVSVPALKHDFEYRRLEMAPGNAATHYRRAFIMLLQTQADEPEGTFDRMHEWATKTPLKDLPREDVLKLLKSYEDALHEIRLGGRRESCVWEYPWRGEGGALMLPELRSIRDLTYIIGLKAEIEIAEQNYDEAWRTLRDGYLFGRRVATGPFSLDTALGTGIGQTFNALARDFIGGSGAPSLYWALTGLPSLRESHRRTMALERDILFFYVPELRDPLKDVATIAQWKELMERYKETDDTGLPGFVEYMELLRTTPMLQLAMTMRLVTGGRSLKHVKMVEGLAPHQLACVYIADRARAIGDDAHRLLRLPFHEAREQLLELQERLHGKRDLETAADLADAIVGSAFPWLASNAYSAAASDRHVAALRCVEALRLHAKLNGRKLPAQLSDVRIVPVPDDPMTGKPFEYTLDGATAVLKAPDLERMNRPHYRIHFRITLRKY